MSLQGRDLSLVQAGLTVRFPRHPDTRLVSMSVSETRGSFPQADIGAAATRRTKRLEADIDARLAKAGFSRADAASSLP